MESVSTEKTYISELKHQEGLAEDRSKFRVQASYLHTLRQFGKVKYNLPSFAVALGQEWTVHHPGHQITC